MATNCNYCYPLGALGKASCSQKEFAHPLILFLLFNNEVYLRGEQEVKGCRYDQY